MQAKLNWLTDPAVFQVNRLEAHSDHVCYVEGAPLRQSLDGQWRFVWSPRPALRPADFWREDYDLSAFGTIQVPGHMELQGYGQIQYINTLYPWDGLAELRPPEIDWEDCPVGSYVREFDLEPSLRNRRVRVSFQGAEQAMAEFFRREDSSRLVHYEGVFHCRKFDRISDVESRMYAPPEAVRAYLENRPKKPFLLCEYMHSMGNSLGGMESYLRLETAFPQYQGGFIWDYMDQALWRTDCRGRRVLGYGGDFGDRQSDYAFSGNGILFADGIEKPAMQEVRYWYASQPERAALAAANQQAMAQAVLPAPGETAPLRVIHGDGALGVRGKDFQILFSYPEGGPVSLVRHGREWLWRAPRPAYWRAPTENDLGNGFAARSSIWSAAEAWQVCESVQVLEESEHRVSIRYAYGAPALPGLRTEVTYTVDDRGVVHAGVHYRGGPGRPPLPLLGLRFSTPSPVERVRWLGLSGETYPDRKQGGVFGWHEETPHVPAYLVPQECGCHADTWAAVLEGIGGETLTLEMADAPLSFSALPYTPWQLEQAAHREELPDPVRTVVSLCGAIRGIGGIDSWGSDVEEAYCVSGEENIDFSFRIIL